jgi:hypothetical protein
VKLAPGKRAAQARPRPRANVKEAIEGSTDPHGVNRTVALDHQEGVVAESRPAAARVHRHQDEVRSTERKAATQRSLHRSRDAV